MGTILVVLGITLPVSIGGLSFIHTLDECEKHRKQTIKEVQEHEKERLASFDKQIKEAKARDDNKKVDELLLKRLLTENYSLLGL